MEILNLRFSAVQLILLFSLLLALFQKVEMKIKKKEKEEEEKNSRGYFTLFIELDTTLPCILLFNTRIKIAATITSILTFDRVVS